MREFEAISKESQVSRKAVSVSERSELDEMLRDGARRMLLKAIESEAAAYIEAHSNEVDEEGRRLVVRNGHAAERTLVSGAGILKSFFAKITCCYADSLVSLHFATTNIPRSVTHHKYRF